MARSDAYATADEYLAVYPESVDRGLIQRHLQTCSRYVENEAGEWFGKDTEAATYLFRGDGSPFLQLDRDGMPGLAVLTDLSIKVDTDGDGSFADETALVVNTLRFYGRGDDLNPDKHPEPQPYRRIELTSQSAISSFPFGRLVQVVGFMGWPSVPQSIWSVVIELCGIWRVQSPRSTGSMNELDAVVSTSPMAQGLVKRFKAPYMRAVVA